MRKRTWCAAHYSQWTRTGEVKPFGYKWAEPDGECEICGAAVKAGTGSRRVCSTACQQLNSTWKGQRPTELICKFCDKPFPTTKRDSAGRLQRTDTIWCPDCGRDSPEVKRFKRYGVTKERFDAATVAGCEICGRTDKPLHVDHDHSCCTSRGRTCGNCIRGFLCGSCNRGLGLYRDQVELLQQAIKYLQQKSE